MNHELRASYLQEARELLRNDICYIAFALSVTLGLSQLVLVEIRRGPTALSLLSLVMLVAPVILWRAMQTLPTFSHVALVSVSLALVLASLQWTSSAAAYGFLILPGLLASLLLGPTWGVATTVVAGGLALRLLPTSAAALSSQLGAGFATTLVALLACAQAFVWGATRHVRDGMEWSWQNYQRNAALLDEARDQRLHMKQVQSDLLQANTELARLTDRLAAMRLVAEEARRSKEEFVANVSHELRTPLNMILGFSEMIMQSPQAYGERLPAALLADVGVILRNSQHLSSMVNDVLDLARMDASPTGLRKQWCRVGAMVAEAEEAVRPLFESKGLYLRSDVADVEVYGDPTRLRQVLLNLLSNAARATKQGGVTITVQAQAEKVVLSVADTGPGIAPDDRERVFEPFRQAGQDVLQRQSGTGLGLTLSRRFVQLHGGDIWLESEVGGGSTFSFSVPRPVVEPAATTGVRRWINPYTMYEGRDRPSSAPPPQPRKRYVIVEQNRVLQRLFERYQSGPEVASVSTWEEAQAQMRQSPAHALIINELNGEKAVNLARLRGLPYGTLAISCWVPGAREAAQELGLADYLIKPVSADELVAALDRVGSVRSVLVVDDSVDALQLFTRMVKAARPETRVIAAPNARRALSLLRQHRPDAVLLDLVMPGMTGYEFLREKNADPSVGDIPVIAVSAQDPIQTPLGSDAISVSRSGGLSLSDLFRSIESLTDVLTPSAQAAHPESAIALPE